MLSSVSYENTKNDQQQEVISISEKSPRDLPEIKSVCSEAIATSDDILSVPVVNPILHEEQVLKTPDNLLEIMETKLPQIEMVFSEYNEASNDNNCTKFEAATNLSNEVEEFEGNLSNNNALKNKITIKPFQYQNEAVIINAKNNVNEFCNLETTKEIIEKQTIKNEKFQAADKKLSSSSSNGHNQKEADKNCDKLQVCNSEDWKQISIKEELIEINEEFPVDDDFVSSKSYLNFVKSEFHIKSEDDIIDVEKNSEITFQCQKCNLNFPQECMLRLHMIRHDSNNRNKCDECDFKTKKRFRLLVHLRNHTGEKKIRCRICKEYYYSCNEFRHFQRCPKKIGHIFHCEECEYSTNIKFRYVRHVRIHTGERLKCCWCEKDFENDAALRQHRKKHAKEKRYQCQFCYRRFKMKFARERHVLAYCDKKCPKCEFVGIYCSDFYEHVIEKHPFTKLKMKLQGFYRQCEKIKERNRPEVPEIFKIETEFPKYEPEFNTNYDFGAVAYDYQMMQDVKMDQNESEQNEYNKEENEEENNDYNLIQNVNCELTEIADDYTLLCL